MIFGIALVLGAIIATVAFLNKSYIGWSSRLKVLLSLTVGLFALAYTVPDLKGIITNDLDIVEGACRLDDQSSRKIQRFKITMSQTGETFMISQKLDETGANSHTLYYCEVAMTKQQQWPHSYKIYEFHSRELINE